MKLNIKLKGDLPIGTVLMVVLTIIIAVTLYFVVIPMMASVKAPTIQLDAYNTKALGSYVVFAVKPGSTINYQGAALLDSQNHVLASTANGAYNTVGGCSAFSSLTDAINALTGSSATTRISTGSATSAGSALS